ncbi:MAG: choice-of-anchor tandem repeat GloVer-containing protein, partial [Gammaproteobacteria bacterium]
SILLHAFDCAEESGCQPSGVALGPDGYLYGVTRYGGDFNNGAVFRLTADGELTVLRALDPDAPWWPVSPLIPGNDGHFYGTALSSGESLSGTIYRLTPAGELTVLRTFAEGECRYAPASLIQNRDGTLYGVCPLGGGTTRYGLLFSLSRDGELETLYEFGGAEGAFPATVVQAGDNEFLVAAQGFGPDGGGSIVRVRTEGGGSGGGASGGLALAILVTAALWSYRRPALCG